MTTRLTDNREAALKIGYLTANWTQPTSYEQHVDIAKDWVVKLIERDGQPIGAVFSRDGEVHCSILPEWRRKWLTKGLLRQIIETPNFFTRVDDGHDYMYGILERLGMTRRPDGTVGRI
jgi:hypothetical protein